MGSSPTGHPTKKSAVALQRRIFLFGGMPSGLEQGGGAKRRNQSPSGALISPRVPIFRNVYRGDYCPLFSRRIFLFGGMPGGLEQGGGAKRRNQSPIGALISPRVPIFRNVYRGDYCPLFSRRIFLFGGMPGGLEQGGGAKRRNQSPSGALISPRVPIFRNVYRGDYCPLFSQRIFYLAGCPVGSKYTIKVNLPGKAAALPGRFLFY